MIVLCNLSLPSKWLPIENVFEVLKFNLLALFRIIQVECTSRIYRDTCVTKMIEFFSNNLYNLSYSIFN